MEDTVSVLEPTDPSLKEGRWASQGRHLLANTTVTQGEGKDLAKGCSCMHVPINGAGHSPLHTNKT